MNRLVIIFVVLITIETIYCQYSGGGGGRGGQGGNGGSGGGGSGQQGSGTMQRVGQAAWGVAKTAAQMTPQGQAVVQAKNAYNGAKKVYNAYRGGGNTKQ
ncbi:unnamed protein product [Oppiella nova]|uniref:Uncharacterized protein n=1 Tax=Oppiella nova TaxID=334625 RepID=A0A7R9M3E6_9ACAR|nr:unnamed protein product [Oppiella nova]CAG2169833.1 unnamed protein product [Oppiella nova]